jgi:energy-coupling factor transport system permease protein
MLLVLSVVLNMFFTKGPTVIWHWKMLTLTKEGVATALYIGIRLVELVIGSSLLTFTTTPNELTDGIEKAFRPLTKINVPVHEFAMMMSIALRFIPILTEELDKIMKAQAARCADFEEGSLIQKAKSLVPVLIPLFVSAIQRANDLALAMESRCYQGGNGRTKMYPLQYKRRDYYGYAVILMYFLVMIALRTWVA